MPHQPQIYQLGDRHVVLCEGNITIRNRQIVTVYLARDITADRKMLMTIVSGYLQSLLKRSTNLTEYQQEAIATAGSETDRTVRLLQDLLDLSRVDSGYLHFHAELIALDELAIEIAAIARQIRTHEIEVNANNRVMAIGDRDRLKQVLINSIDNAIKYSPPDSPIFLNVNTRLVYGTSSPARSKANRRS